MRYFNTTWCVALLLLFALPLSGSAANRDSVRYEILMNNKLLGDLRINDNLTTSLAMTAGRLVLLSSASQFYLMGWGNMVPFGKKSKPAIGAFAFTPDSVLMAIRNNELCSMDSTGNLTFVFKLPASGMGITAGEHVMYLYERNATGKGNALYALAPGGRYTKLLEVPRTITSVAEFRGSVLFATENAVLQYNLAAKTLKAIVVLPDNKIIESIAVDPSNGKVYFSAGNLTGTIHNNTPAVITDKLGGTLTYSNGLIVFNPKTKLMIRITGLESATIVAPPPPATATGPEQKTEILTNSTVMDLVRNQLSDDLIIYIISRSKVNFDLGVDAIIGLSEQNVSSRVILAMKQAMSKQTSESK